MFLRTLLSLSLICSASEARAQSNSITAGATLPSTCQIGDVYITTVTPTLNVCNTSNTWTSLTSVGGGGIIPAGLITFIVSGTCPTGWTEVTALNGKTLFGTLAANGDVGGTGGSDTITPTVNSLTAAAQTFTGTPFTSIINHTHTLTITSTSRVQGGTTAATTGTHIMTSTATGGSARAPTAGDSLTGTSDNPSGGVSSITPAGTNGTSSVTGTLNSFDNRSAFTKVIFCQKS